MIKFIMGSLFFYSLNIFACENFSGNYIIDSGIQYSVTQNDCLSMDVIDPSTSLKITFDGVDLLTYEGPFEENGQNVGSIKTIIQSHLEDKSWIYQERVQIVYNDGKVKESDTSKCSVNLTQEGHLQTLCQDVHTGIVKSYLDRRIQ